MQSPLILKDVQGRVTRFEKKKGYAKKEGYDALIYFKMLERASVRGYHAYWEFMDLHVNAVPHSIKVGDHVLFDLYQECDSQFVGVNVRLFVALNVRLHCRDSS